MVLRLQGWLVAGPLLLSLAQAAPAQPVYRSEVLEIPVSARLLLNFHDQTLQPCDPPGMPMSTRLLMTLHDPPALSCVDPTVPMSTLLLSAFRAQSVLIHSGMPTGAADGGGDRSPAPEPAK